MPTVVVRHDLPIAEALAGTRPALTVRGTDSTAAALDALPAADAFVCNPANWDDAFAEALPRGAWVQATSTGYAAFPLDTFEDHGVAFTNARGNYGPPVADHAFALLLALVRGVPACLDRQAERRWDRTVGDGLGDLGGRTLTVVGLGDIGECVARRGRGFDMTVRGTKRDPAAYDGVLPDDRVHPPDALDGLLPDTDALVLTVPLTDATRHLVDADALAALPDSAHLVNVARGGVVDGDALVRALESGGLAGAGLDVFEAEPLPEDSPLWGMENAVLTPHVGGRSASFVDRFVDLFLDNHDRRRAGEAMRNRIV